MTKKYLPQALKEIALLILSFSIISNTVAQTTLAPGDIMFVAYNADGGDDDNFSFILLEDIAAGTEIFFTDIGWTGSEFHSSTAACGQFMGYVSDGIIKWETSTALTCGTEIAINAKINLSANIGTVTGIEANSGAPNTYISLPGGGDQILAYQGTKANPSFIAGISMNTPAWEPLAACEFTSGKSQLPTTLSAVGFTIQPEIDNARYNCNVNTGTTSSLRSAVLNSSNWNSDNSIAYTLPINCTFTCNQNAPEITLQPIDIQVCPNLPASFSIAATNSTSYQWQISTTGTFINATGGNFSGGTTTSLTVNDVTGLDGALFRCEVTGNGGSVFTEIASLEEIFPPSIITQPINAVSCVGCISGFSLEAEGENISYQWQVFNGGSFIDLADNAVYSGTNEPKLKISNIPANIDGSIYQCVTSGTCTPTALSNQITLTLDGSNTSLVAGDMAFIAYNVDDAGVDEEDNFSFVLLKDIDAGTEINITDFGWTNSNAFHSTCNGTQSLTDGIIKWVATNDMTCGSEVFINGKSSLTSNAGIVFGTQSTISNSEEYLPFSGSGDQLFAYQGSHASPTLVSGIYFADDGGWNTSFTDCVDTSSSTSTLPTSLTGGFSAIAITPEVDNAKYNCSVSSGSTISIRSSIMTVTNWDVNNTSPFVLPVNCNIGCNESAPNITMNPSAQTVCMGDPVSFSISAVNATSYQWQELIGGVWSDLSNNTIYTGVETDMLGITNTSGFTNTSYRCVAINTMGNSTSLAATLTINTPPTIVSQPTTAISCVGCNSGFYTEATGTNLTYQWEFSANNGASYSQLSNIAPYSGAQSNKLILTSIPNTSDGYLFRCVISGTCTPTETTSSATLSLTGTNTSLVAGDLAFVSFNADDEEDVFSFVLLVPVSGGTLISLTDFGWTDATAFQNCTDAGVTDGIIQWIATENLPCGSEVSIQGKTALLSNTGIVKGLQATSSDANNFINIPTGGDQIFAFQGDFSSPSLLSGIYNANNTGWDTSLPACESTSSKSILPAALATGFSAIQIVPEIDNAAYDCASQTTNDDPAVLRSSLLDPTHWIGDNTTPYVLPLACNFACCSSTNSSTIYVDYKATGSNDGQSWTDAFVSLQDALEAARTCGIPDIIKIAGGTYFPDQGATITAGDRTSSFVLDFETVLEGGYNPSTDEKDQEYPTYLSGNISSQSLKTDNCYNVIQVSENATISNLTVEHAYNDSPSTKGGGINATNGTFTNLTIRNNEITTANQNGGGLYITGQATLLENLLVYKNKTNSYGGGIAIQNTSGTNFLKNVTLTDNTANFSNGGIDNFSATTEVANSIIYFNTPASLNTFGSTITLNHSILDSPSTWLGTGNWSLEPKFIDRNHENYRTVECWISHNNGDSNAAPSTATDLDGNPRLMLTSIDIGAYEVQREEVRSQIPPLDDYYVGFSCPKNIQVGIENSEPEVFYSMFGSAFEGSVIGDGSDQILTSINTAETRTYQLSGGRNGSRALTFADNKYIEVPYDEELAIEVSKGFTLQSTFTLDDDMGRERLYSQDGSFGIGFDKDELIITRYNIQDTITEGVDITAGVPQTIKVDCRPTGANEVTYYIYLNEVLKNIIPTPSNQNMNTSPIYIGGRVNEEWMNGSIDFIELKKGGKVTLRYDFLTGRESTTVFDFRALVDEESPRNGTMVGFTPSADWVFGVDTIGESCGVFANVHVEALSTPINHIVTKTTDEGFRSLRFAVDQTCPNDTIRFDPINDPTTYEVTSLVSIPHDLNIVGNGMENTILDADNSGSVLFNIPASNVIFMKDFQMTNVSNPTGAFFISDDHTLENILVRDYPSPTQRPFSLDALSNLKIKGVLIIKE